MGSTSSSPPPPRSYSPPTRPRPKYRAPAPPTGPRVYPSAPPIPMPFRPAAQAGPSFRPTMTPAAAAGLAATQRNNPDPRTGNPAARRTDYPITPGTSEVVIIGDSIIKDIRRHLPKEYKVFSYDNATIAEVCSKVRETLVAGHVLQVVLHAGTFDLKSDMRMRYNPVLGYDAEELFSEEFKKIKNDMRELVRYSHEKFPAGTIFISALIQRKTINKDIFDAINGVLEEFAEEITRDLRGVFQVLFFDGSRGIDPWRRLRDGTHLPHEMSEIFANNLKEALVLYRPLKGVEIDQKFEPEIRVGGAINIAIGDCVLKDLRRFLSDDCRVFWYKGGTIDKLKEKVIAMQIARRVDRVILHVGTFELKAFEAIFDGTMDQMIELILICFDRFPKAKVLMSPILPRLDTSAQEVALRINEFYTRLGTVFAADKFGVVDIEADILLHDYEPDGIHLTEEQTRLFARQVTTAFESP